MSVGDPEIKNIPLEVVLGPEVQGDTTGYENYYIPRRVHEVYSGGVRGKVFVVGPGDNSSKWSEVGAITMDIDPVVQPDIIGDANQFVENTEVVSRAPFSVVVLECVPLAPEGTDGLDLETFLPQAYQLLEEGGEVIVVGGDMWDSDPKYNANVPDKDETLLYMRNAGFEGAVFYRSFLESKIHDPKNVGDKTVADVSIEIPGVFYAKKPETSNKSSKTTGE